jgi:hypothetical protein
MSWISRSSVKFWVGRHKTLGLVVIPWWELERKDASDVKVFVMDTRRESRFDRDALRTKVTSVIEPPETAYSAVDEFVSYLRTLGLALPNMKTGRYVNNCWRCRRTVDRSGSAK